MPPPGTSGQPSLGITTSGIHAPLAVIRKAFSWEGSDEPKLASNCAMSSSLAGEFDVRGKRVSIMRGMVSDSKITSKWA
jgi:hypothetical protein